MIEIAKVRSSELVPETKEESFGEMMGRLNALHGWLISEATTASYFSDDLMAVSAMLGFSDVIRFRQDVHKEKASGANAD